ncbi:MAG TPA: endonuclease MutS2, partial [Terriglobia bacterium]|nr:endonuclease MutS2 [Terriglobia bacterium]
MALTRSIPGRVSDCNWSALEWDRLLELLAGYAQSQVGRSRLLELAPSTDADWIAREHTLVDEVHLLLGGDGGLPALAALFDPSDLLAKARIEGVALESEEIRSVATLAEVIAAWADLVRTPPGDLGDRLPRLRELFGETMSLPLKPLVDSLRGRFLP